MEPLSSLTVSKINRYLPVGISYVLVTLMLVSFSALIVSMGRRLFSDWNSDYLVLITLFITLEVLITHRIVEEAPIFSKDWVLVRGAEWIFNLIGVKLIIYLATDITLFWQEITHWQRAFFSSFFSAEYMIALVYAILIWLLARQFAIILRQLEHDPMLLEQERDGYALRDRPMVRKQLMGLIFSLGAIMLVLTALINANLSYFQVQTNPAKPHIWILLLYFTCSMALLAMTQFDVLRSYWYIEKIPTIPHLASRWAVFTILVLLVFTVIAIFLPTRYSLNLLETVGYGFSVLINILVLVWFAILYPFLYVLRWLLGQSAPLTAKPPVTILPTQIPPQLQHPTSPEPLLELIKSFIFWTVILGGITFFLNQYFRQRKAGLQSLLAIPLFGWIGKFWDWIKNSLSRTGGNIVRTIDRSLQTLRSNNRRIMLRRLDEKRRKGPLTPREQVLFDYWTMVEENSEMDLARKPGQTPLEYAREMKTVLPDVTPDIETFTGNFIEARYSQHEISPDTAHRSRSAWEKIRAKLNALRNPRKVG